MKKQITILLPLFILTILMSISSSFAQNPEKQHAKFEQRLKEFSERLNLNPEQQTKVRAIMKQSRVEAKSIIENNTAKEDRKPKMMALAKKTDEQISALLDPKQKELYTQYKVEQKAKRKENIEKSKEMRMEMDEHGIL